MEKLCGKRIITAEENIQKGWEFVFDKLFSKKTKLIYDYRTTEDEDGAFCHLPTRDEILRSYPNPCGWFTGMEDGDINGCIMMEAVIKRYEHTHDESLKKYINDLYEGLMANATVSSVKGFLARARHPEDGVTHYINSSRDQYTHWIDSITRFYFSKHSSESQREDIKRVIVEFAEKAERDVTEENNYSLLDEEGSPALVCIMYGDKVWGHESCRLGMFYLSAYVITGNEHWLSMYHSIRDWGIDKAEQVNLDYDYAGFALMQMQISLRFLYDYETDTAYKQRYLAILKKVANRMEVFLPDTKEFIKDFTLPTTVVSWRDVSGEFLFEDSPTASGKRVVRPNIWFTTVGQGWRKLRNAAESVIGQMLCPNYNISQEVVGDFLEIITKISFEKPCGYIPVSYCFAWWLLKEAGRV